MLTGHNQCDLRPQIAAATIQHENFFHPGTNCNFHCRAVSDALTAQPAQSSEMALYGPETIEWKAGPAAIPPGAKMAVLEGDPTKEGPFVVRFQFPEGYHIPPHSHPKTERVTVISGTLFLAMGENLDRSAARPLTAGTYGFWPAGMTHTAWSEGETVIQLHGIGPWQINYVNPVDDPRNAKK